MRRFPRARPAFTLIELLVVIAIIGILAALLIVAVTAIFSKGPELQTTNDIRQLNIAINNFKQKYGVFPPSQITLSANPALMDSNSLQYVTAIWPRINFSDKTSPIDWAGKNISFQALQNVSYSLSGDQCLVFFLGGVPDSNPGRMGCRGFSSNASNPTDLGHGTKESFFQFDSNRLIFHRANSPFYSFADPWSTGQPYAYFSSNKRKDGYNTNPTDCPSLIPNGPYVEAATNPPRYYNSTTFQIISAGKNGIFGAGGEPLVINGRTAPWTPANATQIGPAGADDQTNFYDPLLGVPQ